MVTIRNECGHMNDCNRPLFGPLGSHVGNCDLPERHDGPCKTDGVSEQDMLDRLLENGDGN